LYAAIRDAREQKNWVPVATKFNEDFGQQVNVSERREINNVVENLRRYAMHINWFQRLFFPKALLPKIKSIRTLQ
jgi:hypothetical protein